MPARRAFTLIELLVVVALVALLAALLLPVLSRGKESGRQNACASNMRQLVIALAMYANEHEGVLPVRSQVNRWPVRLRSGYEHRSVLLCPTDRAAAMSPPGEPTNADAAPRSYVLNTFGDHFAATLSATDYRSFGKGTYPGGFNESAIRHPSETILFGEKKSDRGDFYVDLMAVTASVVEVTEQGRHGSLGGANSKTGGANHAYADGSVRFSKFGRTLCPVQQWAITEAGRTNLSLCIY